MPKFSTQRPLMFSVRIYGMMPRIKKRFRRELKRLYSQMDANSDSCIRGCTDCCTDTAVTYVEFAYLVSQFKDEELTKIFSRPARLAVRDNSAPAGQIDMADNKTIILMDPNHGPHIIYYCPMLLKGGCEAYYNRPWICRDYRRDARIRKCYWTADATKTTANLSIENKILELNNEFAPAKFQKAEFNISHWYRMLSGAAG